MIQGSAKAVLIEPKRVTVSICGPEVPHGLAWDRSRSSTDIGRKLTARAMTPCSQLVLSYLLIAWSRDLPDKLRVPQLVGKFPAFCGTRGFITAFTTARHPSVFGIRSILSIPPHHTSRRSILVLSSHLRLGLPNCPLPSGFRIRTLYASLLSAVLATCPAYLILGLITRMIFGQEYRA